MGRGFHPLTYPWVGKSSIPTSLLGKTHQILGFGIPIAMSTRVSCRDEKGRKRAEKLLYRFRFYIFSENRIKNG
jgi:hypothetical protein